MKNFVTGFRSGDNSGDSTCQGALTCFDFSSSGSDPLWDSFHILDLSFQAPRTPIYADPVTKVVYTLFWN